ncbi:MAG: hypothetical protein SFU86_07605 [Pirellulaceae bacterium]|nr:hypothetical protein [Pirellulaceae bacterium]
MKQRVRTSKKDASARIALRRRVLRWYAAFNAEKWSDCLALVDPRLTSAGKVKDGPYVESLVRFKEHYGPIHPWHVRVSLHLTGSRQAVDSRPFAYVYTVWQDDRHGFHMFRERWVRDGKRWYTEVAGLVVNDARVNQAG